MFMSTWHSGSQCLNNQHVQHFFKYTCTSIRSLNLISKFKTKYKWLSLLPLGPIQEMIDYICSHEPKLLIIQAEANSCKIQMMYTCTLYIYNIQCMWINIKVKKEMFKLNIAITDSFMITWYIVYHWMYRQIR